MTDFMASALSRMFAFYTASEDTQRRRLPQSLMLTVGWCLFVCLATASRSTYAIVPPTNLAATATAHQIALSWTALELKQIEHINVDLFASGGHIAEGTGVRAQNFQPYQHLFAFGHEVQQRQFHVGKGRQ